MMEKNTTRRSSDRPCQDMDDDTLLAYSAGRLDEPRAGAVARHASSCAHCNAFLAAQLELWSALDLWEPEPVAASFNREVWRKIEAASAAPWYRRLAESFRLGAWKPAVPVAALVSMVAVGFVFDHATDRRTAVQPPVEMASAAGAGSGWGVSSLEAEQVESSLEDIQLLRSLE
jgi:anti-sigma factor RsiW